MRGTILVVLIATTSLLALTSAATADVPAFCTPGAGSGKCNGPQGVAADFESGRVYVADGGNERVDVFESGGTPVSSFGSGQLVSPEWVAVDNDSTSAAHHEIYASTASTDFLVKNFKANGEYVEADSFGVEGTGPCQFSANDPIAVGPGGDVFVANSFEEGANNFVNRVLRFDSAGNCLGEVELFEGQFVTIGGFAVDSAGNLYVTVDGAGGVLRKYSLAGALLGELDKGTETKGIAVDAADNVFAKQRGQQVTKLALIHLISEYAPGGTVLKRFGYGTVPLNVPALAANSTADGDLYASEGTAGIAYLTLPTPGPVIVDEACHVKGEPGSVKATLQAEVNPEGKATTFHFDYITDADFQANGNSFSGAKPFTSSAETPLAEGAIDFNLHEAALTVVGLKPETLYHCRIVAKNADGEAPAGEEGTFETDESFKFGGGWTSEVAETTATVNVEGNPLGLAAKGQIEYVTDAQYQADGFAQALSAPPGEIDFGSSEAMQLRSVELSGLAPGTLYHWRLRARNGVPPEGLVCPRQKPSPCPDFEHTFRTYLPDIRADERGYELVSPGQKNSAEVAVPGAAGGLFEDGSVRIQAGAPTGEAITYTSWTSFGQAQGAPATSQYLSKRTAAGWGTENISPFGFIAEPLKPPYTGFSADLRFAALKVTEPPLAPGCPQGSENLYLRDNASGAMTCLTPETPKNSPGISVCSDYVGVGASADATDAFFGAPVAYADAPVAKGTSLYEWSAADGKLHLVSVFPDGTPAAPTTNTSFGAGGLNCRVGQKTLRHVVSADGSKAFWTYVPEEPFNPKTQLFARINGSETVQLDAVQSGAGKSGKGVFWSASADGSVVYFTTDNRLISGSNTIPDSGEEDLYRYEFDKAPGERLTDLTTPGSVVGDVKGLAGTSDDGSYVYFVAGGVLSEEANGAGDKAEAGKDNLYLFHGGETSFIGILTSQDEGDWSEVPKSLSARVSPDGRHLAFLSIEAKELAGYDNTVAEGEHCQYEPIEKKLVGSPLCPQAFLYGADAKELSCASCNPAGTRPLGPALLPGWTNMYEGPRYLSDNGSRLFFETYDALLPSDESAKRDVYEFELSGEGSCSASNPNFDPASGGCHFLVSSGKSTDESFLVDASADGRDVFFSTRSALVGWDVNPNYDVYDYRGGGGFAEPPTPPVSCVGEGCKPTPSAPPSSPTPATPTNTGPGDAKPKQPKPKKKSKKHHKKKQQKKSAKKGRASR